MGVFRERWYCGWWRVLKVKHFVFILVGTNIFLIYILFVSMWRGVTNDFYCDILLRRYILQHIFYALHFSSFHEAAVMKAHMNLPLQLATDEASHFLSLVKSRRAHTQKTGISFSTKFKKPLSHAVARLR